MRDAVIVSAVRTAVGKAPRGGLRSTRPDDMAAVVIREALDRAAPLEADQVEDVAMLVELHPYARVYRYLSRG